MAIFQIITGCQHFETQKVKPPPVSHPAAVQWEAPRPVVRLPNADPDVRVLNMGERDSRSADRNGPARKPPAASVKLRECYVQDLPLEVVVELLTELTGVNLVVIQEAAAQPVRIFLKNATLDGALEAICRSNGLWFRSSGNITAVMTEQAYTDAMVFQKSEKMQAYFMRYTNAVDMAALIATVLSPEVQFRPMSGQSVYGHLAAAKAGSSSTSASASSGATAATGGSQKDAGLTDEERKILLEQGFTTDAKVQEAGEASKKLGKRAPAILTVFKKNNCIVARSEDADTLREISNIIKEMDTPTQQVLIEVKILSITLGDTFQSFFSFDYINGEHSFSTLGGATIADDALTYIFSNDKIQAQISVFAEDNRVKMLAAPFLMAADNAEVNFFVGEETPLRKDVTTKTVSVGDEGDTLVVYEFDIEREEIGTDLTFRTVVNSDRTVTMDIDAEISTPNLGVSNVTLINEKTGESNTFLLDGVDKSEITSVVVVPSDHTVALGGMIRVEETDYDQKVPVLGDIPGLGILFKKIDKEKLRKETVILITPHVIGAPAEGSGVSREMMRRQSGIDMEPDGAAVNGPGSEDPSAPPKPFTMPLAPR